MPVPSQDNIGHALAYSVPFLHDSDEHKKEREVFFDTIVRIPTSSAYDKSFERWKRLMEAKNTLQCTATLGGPLAVGLGDASVTEVGLTLHKTYGVPYIPGSAIKGACLRAIGKLSELSGEERKNAKSLFGSTDCAGYLVFHDAWLVPEREGKNPYQRDTVTVHHPAYYRKEKDVFPTDFDDPIPIPFVSVKSGCAFYFAIGIPESQDTEAAEKWRTFVEKILHYTLTELGLGGKTNAGYGWFKPWLKEEILPPTKETQTWENVELERRDPARGGWVVYVRLDAEEKTQISQGDWQRLGLAVLGKGKRAKANVKTMQEGGTYKVTAITLL
jgi:CRISPR-associated protein Cmr6